MDMILVSQGAEKFVLKSAGMVPSYVLRSTMGVPKPADFKLGRGKSERYLWEDPENAVRWSVNACLDLTVTLTIKFDVGNIPHEVSFKCSQWGLHDRQRIVRAAVKKLTNKPEEGTNVHVFYQGHSRKILDFVM